MKNIVIKVKWIKREAIIILICYLAANLVNALSIAIYNTSWDELWGMQKVVLYIAEWFYLATIAVRLLWLGIRYLIKRA